MNARCRMYPRRLSLTPRFSRTTSLFAKRHWKSSDLMLDRWPSKRCMTRWPLRRRRLRNGNHLSIWNSRSWNRTLNHVPETLWSSEFGVLAHRVKSQDLSAGQRFPEPIIIRCICIYTICRRVVDHDHQQRNHKQALLCHLTHRNLTQTKTETLKYVFSLGGSFHGEFHSYVNHVSVSLFSYMCLVFIVV